MKPEPKVLFIDIETSGMKVRLFDLRVRGWVNPRNILQNGYVLSFAYKWLGEDKIHFVKTSDGHKDMLRKMHKLLGEADAVVHYNGKKFDVPILNWEFVLNKLKPLKSLPVQIDLLPMVRRVFKMPSYSLDYVCQTLGIGRKIKHEGLGLWDAADAAKNQPRALVWSRMSRYNKHDVHLTEGLYKVMRPWFKYAHGYKRIDEWLEGHRSKP